MIQFQLEWISVDHTNDCHIAKVIGGWILRHTTVNQVTQYYQGGSQIEYVYSHTMQFIADPEHSWLKREGLTLLLRDSQEIAC